MGLLKYLVPKSLYAQLLTAVALALLIVQVINAVLLFNGFQHRSALTAVTQAISNYSFAQEREARFDRAAPQENDDDANSRNEARKGRRNGRRNGLRNGRGQSMGKGRERRLSRFYESEKALSLNGFVTNDEYSERAFSALSGYVDGPQNIIVSTGPIASLPQDFMNDVYQRPLIRRLQSNGLPMPKDVLLLSVRQDDGSWKHRGSIIRPIPEGRLMGLIIQTLLIYLAIMVPLALIARRIAKPLANLRVNMAQFHEHNVAVPVPNGGPQDVSDLISTYNALQMRVSELLSEKDVMLGAIGHDLKTPLASLRIRVENVEDAEEREGMANSIDELSAMLDDILMLARLGNRKEGMKQLNIGNMLSEMLQEYNRQGHNVSFTTPKAAILSSVRPVMLRRALRNLIDNALRYGEDVEIALQQDDTGISFIVSDTGPGIPEADISSMFEPFHRGDGSRNRGSGGSGLGLTISRAIARAHNGDVTIVNRLEGGLSATLWIKS